MLLLSNGYKEEYLKSKAKYIHSITWIGCILVFVPPLVGKYEPDASPYAMLGSSRVRSI